MEAARALARTARWWDEDGRALGGLGVGFALGRVVDEGATRLLANASGGFRVRCPACGGQLSGPFTVAVGQWREGGPAEVTCPTCQAVHALHRVVAAPPLAFARVHVHLVDVDGVGVAAAAIHDLEALWGPIRVVPRRIG